MEEIKLNLSLEELQNYKHIHLIGIGGISMSAIAETLKKRYDNSMGYFISTEEK